MPGHRDFSDSDFGLIDEHLCIPKIPSLHNSVLAKSRSRKSLSKQLLVITGPQKTPGLTRTNQRRR